MLSSVIEAVAKELGDSIFKDEKKAAAYRTAHKLAREQKAELSEFPSMAEAA